MLLACLLTAVFFGLQSPNSSAMDALVPHDGIFILNDNFTAENGVTEGSGTYDDPFVIEGWDINISQSEYDQSQNHHGIYIAYSEDWFVIRNVTIHSGLVQIDPNSFTGGDGIVLQNSAHGRIENCKLIGNLAGMEIMWCEYIQVFDNTIQQNLHGVMARDSSSLRIEENDISSNSGGNLDLDHVTDSLILNNSLGDSGSWIGLNLYGAERCTVTGNRISYNAGIGVNIGFCKDCTITNNTITNNRLGMAVYGSEETVYEPNYLRNNEDDIQGPNEDSGVLGPAQYAFILWIGAAVVLAIVAVLMERRRINPPGKAPTAIPLTPSQAPRA
jgi:parallel beta-helix repeat protein